MFVDSKINNKSQNTRISLVFVERLDLYMKYGIKIETDVFILQESNTCAEAK